MTTTVRRPPGARQAAVQRAEHLLARHRLHEVLGCAERERLAALVQHRDDDHRERRGRRVGLEVGEHVPAVEARAAARRAAPRRAAATAPARTPSSPSRGDAHARSRRPRGRGAAGRPSAGRPRPRARRRGRDPRGASSLGRRVGRRRRSGTAKANVLPAPTLAPRATAGRRAARRCAATASGPRPVPSVAVRAPRPPRWNASKMRSRSAVGDAHAGVAHRHQRVVAVAPAR